jgi:predicted ATP-grasp superfamily ATP-dependent carboligase
MGCYTVGVIDKEVEEIGLDALRRIGYQGIASINLKRDPSDGSVKILEINPRCSLWNHLATRSGVNIPALAYSDLAGHEWKIENPHRIGYYWWNVKEDLKSLIAYRRAGEWTIGQWIRSLFTKKECHVFAWRDPAPALYHFLYLIRIRFKRLFKPA